MSLPLYKCEKRLDDETLARLKAFELAINWQNQKVPWNVRFFVAVDGEFLHYHIWMPTGPDAALREAPSSMQPEFTEGLWNHNVAELFLKSDSSSSYQEINLAPDGRWWSALFSGYRVQDTECRMKEVETFSECAGTDVHFGIRIPRSEIRVDIAFSTASRMSITAIVRAPLQEFLIWSPPKTEKPDFHVVDQSERLQLILLMPRQQPAS